jgi:hypothetical protein
VNDVGADLCTGALDPFGDLVDEGLGHRRAQPGLFVHKTAECPSCNQAGGGVRVDAGQLGGRPV